MDYTTTEAYKRGIEHAAAQLALQPPDDGTIRVTRDLGVYEGREEFELCRLCGWARDSQRCPHGESEPQDANSEVVT